MMTNPSPGQRKIVVSVTLDPEILAVLDAIASQIARGNRSDAVRQMIEGFQTPSFFAISGTHTNQNDDECITGPTPTVA
jgi:hypothetical protein